MAQLAAVEVQRLRLQEAGELDIDWATTGIYFLKGVHLLVLPVPLLAHHPLPTAETETAATRGTGEGIFLLSHVSFCNSNHNFLFLLSE